MPVIILIIKPFIYNFHEIIIQFYFYPRKCQFYIFSIDLTLGSIGMFAEHFSYYMLKYDFNLRELIGYSHINSLRK